MSANWAVCRAYFHLMLHYRVAALAGIGTQLVFGLIHTSVFIAFYRSSDAVQPIAIGQVISYVWLTQAMFALVLFRPDPEIAAMIRDGSVAHELLRPVNLQSLWLARIVGSRSAMVTVRAIPMFVIAGAFLGLQPPASLAAAGLWAVAAIGMIVLSASIILFVSLSLFWTISGDGIAHVTIAATWIFSGMLLPLPLFPEWMQWVLNVLPFRGLIDGPFRIYIGHIPPHLAWHVLLHQAVWIALFALAAHAILRHGLRRLVVQGG